MEGHAVHSALPAIVVFGPILASLLAVPLGRWREAARDAYAVAVALAALVGVAVLVPGAVAGTVWVGEVAPLLGRLTFRVDPFGLLFGLFTAFVWVASTLYAGDYMRHEGHRDRYQAVNLALLGANLGVVFAGDLITLYLFFEALGLLAFWLIVHAETPEAKKASVKYLWMTVLGGLMLLAGIFLAYAIGSNGTLGPIPMAEGTEMLRWAAAVLMVAGFGVKAGVVPLHIWLPDAHSVAPTPASALLSGVMIKAGAYGIFRVIATLFRPAAGRALPEEAWHFVTQLGLGVLWLGIATMFIGVVLALLQSNAKRMLAYHSISQMGFIVAAFGAAGYLGPEAAMGLAGGLFHVLNHALFKACLFLCVGAVFFRTGELDMYKLGGLWRKMPLTFLFTVVAALGITGMPPFNGYVSKTLIHHALVEAYALHGVPALKVAEYVFIATCGGTACSFMKLVWFVFLGRPKRDFSDVTEAPPRMLVAMGALASAVIFVGLAPQLVLQGFILPGLHAWGLEPGALLGLHLWTAGNLMAVVEAFGIGAVVLFVGVRFGLFHAQFPAWMSIEYWYFQGVGVSLTGTRGISVAYAACQRVASRIAGGLSRAHQPIALMYARWIETSSVWIGEVLAGYRAAASEIAAHASRRWAILTSGAPLLARNECVGTAFSAFDAERAATVREAISAAGVEEARRGGYRDPAAAVAEIADYMATRVMRERLAAVGEATRRHSCDSVEQAMARLAPELSAPRSEMIAVALRLADERREGRNVMPDAARAVERLLGEDRYDMRLRGYIVALAAPLRVTSPDRAMSGLLEGLVALKDASTASSAATRRAGRWSADIAHLVISAVARERVPWMLEERMDADAIVATRTMMQRYARDLSLNLAVAVAVFVVLVAAAVASTR